MPGSVLLLDDDAELSAWALPETEWMARFAEPEAGRIYTAPSAAVKEFQPCDADVLALHAGVLGASIPAAVHRLSGTELDARSFLGSTFADMPHPFSGPPRIRYTLNGFLRDTGSAFDHHILWQGLATRREIFGSDERRQALKAGPRCAFTGMKHPKLLNGAYFHRTTCVGLDLRGLVGPVAPHGRGEDNMLGALLRRLYPDDFGLRLPFGMAHRLGTARPWPLSPAKYWEGLYDPDLLAIWIKGLRVPSQFSPERRLMMVAESILETAGQYDAVLAQRIRDHLIARQHQSHAGTIKNLQRALARESTACPAWRKDAAALSDELLAGLRTPTELPVDTLRSHAASMRLYAEAIPTWIRAFKQRAEAASYADFCAKSAARSASA
jgi:hypothetical protein